MEINRRNYYRISYPESERPRFVFGTSISEVMQFSERGLRFRTAGLPPAEGCEVVGRFTMCHGCEISVVGRVVWSDENTVALNLDRSPIPFLVVMREQIYLRRAREQQRHG